MRLKTNSNSINSNLENTPRMLDMNRKRSSNNLVSLNSRLNRGQLGNTNSVLLYKHRIEKTKSIGLYSGSKFYLRKYLHAIRFVILAIVFALFGFLLYGLASNTNFLVVKSVTMRPKNQLGLVNEFDLRRVSEDFSLGKNILSLDVYEVAGILRSNFLGIKDVNVIKEYSGNLIVSYIERNPLGIISVPEGFFMVDESGFVMGSVAEEYFRSKDILKSLPVINYKGDVRIGGYINKEIIPSYIELYESIEKKKVKASSVSFNTYYMEVNLQDGLQILLGTDKNISLSLDYVSDLLKQLKVEGRTIRKIDLRYDKVIVEY